MPISMRITDSGAPEPMATSLPFGSRTNRTIAARNRRISRCSLASAARMVDTRNGWSSRHVSQTSTSDCSS